MVTGSHEVPCSRQRRTRIRKRLFSREYRTLALLITCSTLASPTASDPTCVAPSIHPAGFARSAETIGFQADNPEGRHAVAEAVALWTNGCRGIWSIDETPTLLANREGDRTVRVRVMKTVSPRSGLCGAFRGNEIIVWTHARTRYGVVSCGPAYLAIAHEIGHVLRLGDAPDSPACTSFIMAGAGFSQRWVHPEECALVARLNRRTRAEDSYLLATQPEALRDVRVASGADESIGISETAAQSE